MSNEDVPAAPNPKSYSADQITIFGVALNIEKNAAYLPLEGNRLKLAVVPFGSDTPIDRKRMVIAVVYGYAFEGHCYRLDQPKLFVFEPRTTELPAVGCGFDGGEYAMWQITKKTRMLELATSVDLAEELVLNASLPGNRSPNTYGNRFQLAHRGGKLYRGSVSD
ncbi:hypothetical protein NKI25_33075 [Mesorhizobium sp. M0808]|uniref:hypothetical protein n=1 Tax=Mesorhizobium sp. M0808 TaxID=2957002 RepID=UPI0033354AD5